MAVGKVRAVGSAAEAVEHGEVGVRGVRYDHGQASVGEIVSIGGNPSVCGDASIGGHASAGRYVQPGYEMDRGREEQQR